MRRRWGTLFGWAAAIAVAAVGVAAAVDALTGGGPEAAGRAPTRPPAAALHGPYVPAPGALAGTLYVADPRDACRLRALDLATLALGPRGPTTACRVWAAPTGERAVVAREGEDGGRDLWLVELGDPPRIGSRLGPSRSAPSWSRDGERVAWCLDDGESVVADLRTGERERLPGCFPRILADGAVVTTERGPLSSIVYVDGERALGPAELARGFAPGRRGGSPRVLGDGIGPDGALVLAVSRPTGLDAGGVLELWRSRSLTRAFGLEPVYGPAGAYFGFRIETSPDGSEAALVFPGAIARQERDDLAAFVDLRTGRPLGGLTELPFRALAWSPDGAWLALATGAEVGLYGAARDEPAYVLPFPAAALAWTPARPDGR
jgi:hypothetical protein